MKKVLFCAICVMALVFAGCDHEEPATSNKVETGAVTEITRSTALFHGTVNVDISTYNDVEFGIMIAESKEELNAREGYMFDAKILIGKEFKLEIGNLSPSTLYYYCAWLLLNNTQYEFGSIKDFNTLGASAPIVTTIEATEIGLNSARVGGNIIDDGGSNVVEYGVCYSTSTNPDISDSKIVCESGFGEFVCDLTNLTRNTKYYVRAYATNSIGTAYGNEIKFTTLDKIAIEAVDLGLSVKWANMNVGAISPEDYGDYFAWGETTTKETYNWSTYKWCNGNYDTQTKYNNNSNYGTVDNKTTLDLSDDAARANWGGSWRMPTDAEMTELLTNCTWTWTTQNGVNGYKVTSKKSGYTSNSIFLPAAGYRGNSSLGNAGSYGNYWSSSLNTDNPDYACGLYFYSGSVYRSSYRRSYGRSVRPVCQ